MHHYLIVLAKEIMDYLPEGGKKSTSIPAYFNCYFAWKYLGMIFPSYFPALNLVVTITSLLPKHSQLGKKAAIIAKEAHG